MKYQPIKIKTGSPIIFKTNKKISFNIGGLN